MKSRVKQVTHRWSPFKTLAPSVMSHHGVIRGGSMVIELRRATLAQLYLNVFRP